MMTRPQYQDWINPALNKLWGIKALIEEKQELGIGFIDFSPSVVVPLAVVVYLQSSPWLFTVTFTMNGANREISKISWN